MSYLVYKRRLLLGMNERKDPEVPSSTSWILLLPQVVAIRADDPKAHLVNDVEDVEREFPGELEKIMVWFRDYKMPDGKPANEFGYDSKPLNKEFALKVIAETHGFYNELKSGAVDNSGELALA